VVQDLRARYHGRDDYVRRIRIAAQDLVARGYLLSDDAAVIAQEAASSNLFAPAASRWTGGGRPCVLVPLSSSPTAV